MTATASKIASVEDRISEIARKGFDLPTTQVAVELFEALAPIMGWAWPTSDVVFEPTIDVGSNTRPTPTRVSHTSVSPLGNNNVISIGEKANGKVAVQAAFRQPVPPIDSSVLFLVNDIPLWMTATKPGKQVRNNSNEMVPFVEDRFDKIMPSRSKLRNPTAVKEAFQNG